MKFVSLASKVASALNDIVGIVNRKNPIHGFANVKISLRNNTLELLTTDSEISISELIDVEGQSDGQISIDAILFYDAVRRMKADSQVCFSVVKSRLSITNGVTKFLIPFVTDVYFPSINEEDKKYSLSITTCDAINFFEKTKCAISLENIKMNLTGVFLHSHDQALCAAATDCNRLAYATSKVECKHDIAVIIPRKAIIEFNKLINKIKPESILITFHGNEQFNKVMFHFAKIKIITKLIVGQFPNYRKAIPSEAKFILTLDTKNMIEIIERVSIIASDKSRAIKFNILHNELKIYMSNTDSGFAEETIILENFSTNEELEIALNYSYLLESLHPINGKSVTFKIIDDRSAILIEDTENKNIGYVIMPMVG